MKIVHRLQLNSSGNLVFVFHSTVNLRALNFNGIRNVIRRFHSITGVQMQFMFDNGAQIMSVRSAFVASQIGNALSYS